MENKPIRKKYPEKIKPIADTISIKEVYDKGNELKNPEYKCLYYILYLTGARVGEIIDYLRVRDIDYKTLTETDDNDNTIIRSVAVFDVVTEKRKDRPKRKLPVMYKDTRVADAYYYENLMIEYIKAFNNSKMVEEKVFRVKRTSATNYYKRHIQFPIGAVYKGKRIDVNYRMHPHYLRHCRITHMREMYGFDILDLKQFAGWTSTKMTDTYLHAGWRNLIGKMINNG